jgi:PHD/YefM family antitoxin component YafN of YafNO toxin-antitoxin module
MRQDSEAYAPNVNRIYSLTEFQRKAKEYLSLLKNTRIPLVLTVNGKASVVVQDAPTYQEMVDRIKADNVVLSQLVRHRGNSEKVDSILEELSIEFS